MYNDTIVKKRGDNMKTEAKMAKDLAIAFAALPEEKREFIIGYTEGVIAMTNQRTQQPISQEQKPAS